MPPTLPTLSARPWAAAIAAPPQPDTTPAPDTVPLPSTPHPAPEPLTDPAPPDISDPPLPGGAQPLGDPGPA